MRKNTIGILLLFALASCTMPGAFARTIDVRLRIHEKESEEKPINRENLIKIKQFILEHGNRETYCNLYSNNPAYHTKN